MTTIDKGLYILTGLWWTVHQEIRKARIIWQFSIKLKYPKRLFSSLRQPLLPFFSEGESVWLRMDRKCLMIFLLWSWLVILNNNCVYLTPSHNKISFQNLKPFLLVLIIQVWRLAIHIWYISTYTHFTTRFANSRCSGRIYSIIELLANSWEKVLYWAPSTQSTRCYEWGSSFPVVGSAMPAWPRLADLSQFYYLPGLSCHLTQSYFWGIHQQLVFRRQCQGIMETTF